MASKYREEIKQIIVKLDKYFRKAPINGMVSKDI